MVKNYAKTMTIVANSFVDNMVVLGMRATLNEDGTWGISKNVRNSEAYLINKEICDADYREFEERVLNEVTV